MTVNNKRVFYVKYLAHEIYVDILKKRPDVRLDRLENDTPEAQFAPVLAEAHAYQIGAARDELAPHFHAHAELLKRAPNLLIVSSNGAGFDPVDVDACTAAGVLVVNQSGGNANSVAEHALGMLLTLSKRILEADRALRREANVNRNALIGNEAQGKTIGIVGLGNVGRRIAELCKGLLHMKVIAYDPYLPAEVMAARGGEKVELDLFAAPRRHYLGGQVRIVGDHLHVQETLAQLGDAAADIAEAYDADGLALRLVADQRIAIDIGLAPQRAVGLQDAL